jgi:hypothetical protein
MREHPGGMRRVPIDRKGVRSLHKMKTENIAMACNINFIFLLHRHLNVLEPKHETDQETLYRNSHTLYKTQTQCYFLGYVGLVVQEVSQIFPKCATKHCFSTAVPRCESLCMAF